MNAQRSVRDTLARLAELEAEAKAILAQHEASPDRVISLEESYAKLDNLSLAQDELFRESLRAVQSGLFRAAHVLAWAGFIDFLHNFFVDDHGDALRATMSGWTITNAESLRDHSDFQVIEAGKTAKVYKANTMRALHGYLDRRNECAHPSDYFPDLNRTLGYVSELVDRIERLNRGTY
jgi:hypothetical protein